MTTPRSQAGWRRKLDVPVQQISPTASALAGAGAGVCSTFLLYPLDTIKIRIQVHEASGFNNVPYYRGTWDAMRTIFLKEGIHGLYRGSSAAVIASAGSWGVYWYAYSFLKNVISSINENRLLRTSEQSLTSKLRTPVIASAQEIGISPLHLFWSSSAASAAGILLTNPLWLVKTRLQLETDNSRYKGVIDASIRIFRQERLHGLYRGLLPALVLTCEGALQFVVYEELRKHVINHKSAENPLLFFVLGAASKVVASTAMYPAQVVRSRMMQRPVDGLNCSRDPMGLLETIRRTWKFEGVRGFYKGLVPNTLRTLPASALTFCLYERFLRELVDKF